MFERTSSGQQNRAIFYGANFTCYVEGGGGAGDDRSADASFWQQVLTTLRPDLTIVYLPRGGKPVLEALAHDLVAKDLSNVLVAMDVDYDRLIGDIISDPRVLYTHGYSFENDIYNVDAIANVYKTLSHRATVSNATKASFADGFDNLAKQARRATRLDALALAAGSSLLPRDAPGRVIKTCPGTGRPTIDNAELIKLSQVVNKATRPRAKSAVSAIPNDLRYFVGHCLSHAICILTRSILKDSGIRKSMSSDHIRDVAILSFGSFMRLSPAAPVAIFHQSQAAAIP